MILLAHMLLGALLGEKIGNPVLGISLAFLSHYALDLIPHVEYSIENISKRIWAKSFWDFAKVFIDGFSALILIFLFSNNQPVTYIAVFFSIVPDAFSVIGFNKNDKYFIAHNNFHQEKIHFLKYKKISNEWRVFSQILVVGFCLFLFIILS